MYNTDIIRTHKIDDDWFLQDTYCGVWRKFVSFINFDYWKFTTSEKYHSDEAMNIIAQYEELAETGFFGLMTCPEHVYYRVLKCIHDTKPSLWRGFENFRDQQDI